MECQRALKCPRPSLFLPPPKYVPRAAQCAGKTEDSSGSSTWSSIEGVPNLSSQRFPIPQIALPPFSHPQENTSSPLTISFGLQFPAFPHLLLPIPLNRNSTPVFLLSTLTSLLTPHVQEKLSCFSFTTLTEYTTSGHRVCGFSTPSNSLILQTPAKHPTIQFSSNTISS